MLVIARPNELKPEDIERFVKFVKDFGDIPNKDFIDPGVRRACALVCRLIDDSLVGVAAIKRPLDQYKECTFKKADSQQNPKLFSYELGYIAVHTDYRKRGIGTGLIKSAMEAIQGQPVFATANEGNSTIHRRLIEHEFVREGNCYRSKEGDYNLILLVHPRLMPEFSSC